MYPQGKNNLSYKYNSGLFVITVKRKGVSNPFTLHPRIGNTLFCLHKSQPIPPNFTYPCKNFDKRVIYRHYIFIMRGRKSILIWSWPYSYKSPLGSPYTFFIVGLITTEIKTIKWILHEPFYGSYININKFWKTPNYFEVFQNYFKKYENKSMVLMDTLICIGKGEKNPRTYLPPLHRWYYRYKKNGGTNERMDKLWGILGL